MFAQCEPAGESKHVRIDYDAGRDAVTGAEHYVRRFSRDAGELEQFLHRARNRATVPLEKQRTRPANALRLVSEEPGAVDVALELLLLDGQKVRRAAILGEEVAGDEVHALIRAL